MSNSDDDITHKDHDTARGIPFKKESTELTSSMDALTAFEDGMSFMTFAARSLAQVLQSPSISICLMICRTSFQSVLNQRKDPLIPFHCYILGGHVDLLLDI